MGRGTNRSLLNLGLKKTKLENITLSQWSIANLAILWVDLVINSCLYRECLLQLIVAYLVS